MQQAGIRAWIPAVSAAIIARPERVVWVWIFLGLALRLTLALTTVGTNDIVSWQLFMDTIHQADWVRVYHLIPLYNHPPLMSVYLKAIYPWAGGDPHAFRFLIRFPAILADAGPAVLMVRLGKSYFSSEFAGRAAAIVCLTPILVLVSGFHGNTDPLFVFLFMLAAERVLVGGWRLGGGVILGLSLGIKIVPILLFPLFFFWFKTWKERTLFFLGVGAAAALIFGYHMAVDYQVLYRNVFGYNSTPGEWGYTQFLLPFGLWPTFLRVPAKYFLLAAITGAVYQNTRGREGEPKALLEGIGLTYLVFLVVSPGFGMQYLAWLAAPGLFLFVPKWTARYHFLAGLLAFSIYNHWCSGEPFLKVAGAGRWIEWEKGLGLATWLTLIAWLWKWFDSASERSVA